MQTATEKKMIDLHCHTLFGVDDGSDSFETSCEMLRCAAEDGIRLICLTPHYHKTKRQASQEELTEKIGHLKTYIDEKQLPLKLYLGNELFFSQETVEDLDCQKALTINGTDYALVEFDPGCEYSYLTNALSQLQMGGYRPVVAHVERYLCMTEKPERVGEIHSRGAVIQLNASSVAGDLGWKMKWYCRKLIRKGWVDLVASDAHNMRRRKPVLSEAFAEVEKKFGKDIAEKLFYRNPLGILKGEKIS